MPVDEPAVANGPHERLAALHEIVVGFVANLADDPRSRLRLLVADTFAKLCRTVGAQRATYYELHAARHEALLMHEWHVGSTDALPAARARVDLAAFPLTPPELVRHAQGTTLGSATAAWFGAATCLAVPVVVDGRALAVLLVHWSETTGDEDGGLSSSLRVLAHLIEATETRGRLLDRPAFDEDTGLANRKLALLWLDQTLARMANPTPSGVAVLQCEITGLVHQGAFDLWTIDRVLIESARVLRRMVGEADVVAQFAPTRFVVVCAEVTSAAAAFELAERARVALHACFVDLALRFSPIGWTQMVDARFGLAYTDKAMAPGVLLRQADSAACLAVDSSRAVVLASS